jgi:hypothetical protein
MDVVTESALRILLPRRNLHGMQRIATRALIHGAVGQLRLLRGHAGHAAR